MSRRIIILLASFTISVAAGDSKPKVPQTENQGKRWQSDQYVVGLDEDLDRLAASCFRLVKTNLTSCAVVVLPIVTTYCLYSLMKQKL